MFSHIKSTIICVWSPVVEADIWQRISQHTDGSEKYSGCQLRERCEFYFTVENLTGKTDCKSEDMLEFTSEEETHAVLFQRQLETLNLNNPRQQY